MAVSSFSPPRVDRSADAWETRSLRSLLTPRSERDRPDLPLLTVARERGVFVRADDDANHNAIPDDLSNYKVARSGDLVINKMKAWQGSLGLAPVDGIVSPAYFVFEADFKVPRFGEYLLRSKPFVAKFGAASDGVRIGQWDLDISRMRNIEVSLPQADEQAAIAKYLAHANARIDKAITAKRRLSSLLEEQRRAVAHEHLTHGGWPSWPLGKIGRIGNGSTPSRSVQSYWGGTTPWLNSSVVNQESVSQSNQFVTDEALANCHLPLVSAESVLVGITGQGRTRGMSTVLRIEATVNQHIAFITPNEKLASADYVNLALTVGYEELRQISEGVGGTKGALALTDLKSFKIPLPSLSQQEQVLADVRRLSIELRNALTRVQREISLLGEFRTRLVADVVTGQVDVRAIAASLPDTPEQHTDLGSLLDDDIEDVLGQGEE